MAGFQHTGEMATAFDEGRVYDSGFRKVPSQASTAGRWVDLSSAAGNPVPNYYASDPLAAAVLDPWRGIVHGDAKSPQSTYINEISLCTPTAGLVGGYKLLDYLLYYPFVDLDDLDDQVFDNTVTLDRYTDGDGVMAMLVNQTPTTGGGSFTFDYIGTDDVERTSQTVFCDTAAGTIAQLTSYAAGTVAAVGPFLPGASLVSMTGIKRITRYRNLVPNGGLAAMVLVRPLADLSILEVNSPHEHYLAAPGRKPTQVMDPAYLGLIMNCAGSVAAGLLQGTISYLWTKP